MVGRGYLPKRRVVHGVRATVIRMYQKPVLIVVSSAFLWACGSEPQRTNDPVEDASPPTDGRGAAGDAPLDGMGRGADATSIPRVDGGNRFPFPQNQRSARCTYAAGADPEHVRQSYVAWKNELVTASGAGGHLRVRRPNSPGGEIDSTVSEGIAYGMMLAVVMDDPDLFDELWKYSQLWLDANGLMHWYINAAGTAALGTGAATDSDEDMAWALVMASRKWGGSGTLSTTYLEAAQAQIARIWQHEVDHTRGDLLLAGDTWGTNIIFNPSYFAPSEYRVFGEVTGKVVEWNRVIDTGYAVIAKSLNAMSGNATNGLVPAWCDVDGVPKPPSTGSATNYQYDSARTPFRIGQDYCYYGEPRAASYLAAVSDFFATLGAGNIVDGYDLDGRPRPDPATPAGSPQSAVFVGGAAVGAMHDAKYRPLLDDAYARVATGQLLARSRYYNLSWTGLTLAMMTGNLFDYPR
jgi:endoglucanase